ncbi:HAMP domain-containing sensor histidine kinase [Paenibacillus sp. HB172176]|uniref:sensor histidine kinase n=1 Tax=Paenibacillus sp. HB172176 TaxID=2493690 RepID=UPI001438E045|nr:HAMP domain-containing sensor histidine kinase [Paenibacillus sp. HB172176]
MNKGKKQERIGLFYHWTRAYFLNLLVGVIIIALIALLWVRHTTKEQNLENVKIVAQELAAQMFTENGQMIGDRMIDQTSKRILRVLDMDAQVFTIVMDNQRNQVFPLGGPLQGGRQSRGVGEAGQSEGRGQSQAVGGADQPQGESQLPRLSGDLPPIGPILLNLLKPMPIANELQAFNEHVAGYGDIHCVLMPLYDNGQFKGEILLAITDSMASQVKFNYSFLLSLLLGMLLLGWGTIYFLTKRMVRPLVIVAETANALKDGNYDVEVKAADMKEKELYDMMDSIGTMAERLKHMEHLRTLLFAGVTHELKTPIASVSGLIQAVRDDLVQNEERDEFLRLSIQETERLERMVEDLLDFNGFATGALTVRSERIDLLVFVSEVVHQWKMADEDHLKLEVVVSVKGESLIVTGDAMRTQQILVNLMNNAYHAMQKEERRRLEVVLYNHGEGFAGIDICDSGGGIPQEDIPYIFERFYRGEKKRYATRGLGLGLPYSLMLAKAQRGNLYLNRSSPEGTTFTLLLPFQS